MAKILVKSQWIPLLLLVILKVDGQDQLTLPLLQFGLDFVDQTGGLLPFPFATKCIPDLGCFSNGPPFYDPKYRKVSVLPESRETINTTFILYTRPNITTGYVITADNYSSVARSLFDPKKLTKFIIHGYDYDTAEGLWMQAMKNALLTQGDYNVILVEYINGSMPPYYEAIANGRVVGAEIAHLIHFLKMAKGADAKKMHLIGFSLGAHVAGYAGERLSNLARITGLDPSGPGFGSDENEVILDRKDADFVDAIHTGAGRNIGEGYGSFTRSGHVDFYVNGGTNQPGCPPRFIYTIQDVFTNIGNISLFQQYLSCNHGRAVEIYIASITQPIDCFQVEKVCTTLKQYYAGKCSQCNSRKGGCVKMGFYVKPIRSSRRNQIRSQTYYVNTTTSPPYCIVNKRR